MERLTLALYTPSEFVLESRMSKYFDDDKIEGLTIRGRETGVRKLMATNLLKRFESSVHSFRMTLDRVLGYMSDTVGTIDSYEEYRAKHYDTGVLEQIDIDRFDDGFDLDQDDTESMDPDEFATKGKTRFLLSDMDWRTWRDCILRDMDVIHRLLDMVAGIDAAHDAKLQRLYRTISDKQNQPINPGNHKLLIFTAFADTADYLYEHVSKYAGMLGLNTAEVTGTNPGRCTVKKVGGRMSDILACFSPISKERDITVPRLKDTDIDISDRHGLHLRGPEPAGLRLSGQLRHPLESGAHHPTLRAHRPPRVNQHDDPAGELLAGYRARRVHPAGGA